MANLDLPRCKKCGWALLPAMGEIREIAYYCGNKSCSERTNPITTEWERDAAQHEESQPLAPCGCEGCDCGYTIEKLEAENARLREALEAVSAIGLDFGPKVEAMVEAALAAKEAP